MASSFSRAGGLARRHDAGGVRPRRRAGALDSHLRDRPIDIVLPPDGALAPFDGVLIEQVPISLLENSSKYTPPGNPIDIAAHSRDNMLTMR